jgi:DNA-binding NarL/FixJ family response regulator
MNRPRVLLADDHHMVTEGLKSLLAGEFEVVSEIPEPLPPVAGPVLK